MTYIANTYINTTKRQKGQKSNFGTRCRRSHFDLLGVLSLLSFCLEGIAAWAVYLIWVG